MRICKYCQTPNAKYIIGVSAFCGYSCVANAASKLLPQVKIDRGKAERKEKREQLAILNQNIPYWTKKAQIAFNTFIRLRDYAKPCISCLTTGPTKRRYLSVVGGFWDCGHYLSVGAAAELRFSEDNAHKQCKKCNRRLSGNAVRYRMILIERIGLYRVEVLEGPHDIPHWKWWHYEATYKWYNTLNIKMRKEQK